MTQRAVRFAHQGVQTYKAGWDEEILHIARRLVQNDTEGGVLVHQGVQTHKDGRDGGACGTSASQPSISYTVELRGFE